jgi:hypothetical protein
VLVTKIVCVVAPVFQVFPVALLELSTTLPPAQNVVGPPAVMLGVGGGETVFTVTEAGLDKHPPELTRKV